MFHKLNFIVEWVRVALFSRIWGIFLSRIDLNAVFVHKCFLFKNIGLFLDVRFGGQIDFWLFKLFLLELYRSIRPELHEGATLLLLLKGITEFVRHLVVDLIEIVCRFSNLGDRLV